MGLRAKVSAVAVAVILAGIGAGAQTLATGDSRTVTEPVFPPVCTTLTAQLQIVNGAPSSETQEDTSRIQTALTGCASGKAVELAGGGGNWAYLIGPINIPSGVSLIVDGGVTVFASRIAADYQVSGASETCGSYGANGNACKNIISVANSGSNTGSGIYGYGVIDGRGASTLLTVNGGVVTDTGISWYKNADTGKSLGFSQDNPILLYAKSSKNFTLYKITIRNSPMFHVKWQGTSTGGFTAWGVKVEAPFTGHNTDGIDPSGQNITVTNSSISDGDDDVAVSASSADANITVSNTTTYSGHGISIGSGTSGGLNNMLVTNVNQAGTAADGNSIALRIKSYAGNGGLVQNVTYQNVCIRDTKLTLDLDPFYSSSSSSTNIPSFQNIVFQNIHVLTPTVGSLQYYVTLEGHDSSVQTNLTMNNVVFDSNLSQSHITQQYATINLMGNIYPAVLAVAGGPNVGYNGTYTTSPVGTPTCDPTKVFPYMTGELFVQTSTATNLQSTTIGGSATATLNAVVQPAMAQTAFTGTAGTWAGAPALTQKVNFYEGSTLAGSASLAQNGANDTLASLTLSGLSQGTHTYTAQYPGDSNYAAFSFGSVMVTVAAATAATTTTLNITGAAAYGTTQTLTATVSSTVSGTPTGTVTFYDGATTLGSAVALLSNGTASMQVTLGAGQHSLTAVYSGDSTYVTSTSAANGETISQAATTVTASANPSTVALSAATSVSVTVAGVAGFPPTGTVSLVDVTGGGSTALGSKSLDATGAATIPLTLSVAGTRTIQVNYAGDANNVASSGSLTVTVNPATPTFTLTTSASNVVGFSYITITATATGPSGAATPTGTVSVTDSLGGPESGTTYTATLNNGVASSYSIIAKTGTHTLTATYSGDANYAGATATASVAVSSAPSTTTLTISPTTAYSGEPITLTAGIHVTNGTGIGSNVTFSQGSTTISSGAYQATGASALTFAPTTAGTYTYTATAADTATITGSSGTATLTVVSPWTATVTSPVSVAAGGSGTSTVSVTSQAGYNHPINLSCSSPVSYVTCTPATTVVQMTANATTTTSVTISVAATIGSLRDRGDGILWASLLGFVGLCGLGSRRRFARLLAVLLMAASAASLSGCGGSSTPAAVRPTGSQTLTVTLTQSGITTTTPIVVNIQ